jgi:fibronectin type 3 domain-containing protein/TolB-like protein
MTKRFLATIIFLLLICPPIALSAATQVRLSVFNFGVANMEASGLGTTVTNTLIDVLAEDSTLTILDRKELESFLSMNDLQQNDQIDNVVNIGTRLGLNVIVVGNVEKKGAIVRVQCKAIQVDQKQTILNTKVSAIGDTALNNELKKLSKQIRTAITEQSSKTKNVAVLTVGVPLDISMRPGNSSIHLLWGVPSGSAVAGYEIFRATSETGPFARLGQVAKTEYIDEGVDKNTSYFYKIRAFNERGIQSDFSSVIEAKTAITPGSPVILKTEGRVKSICLLWSPGPSSGDPLRLKGYRLYRAKKEQGPYKEVVNLHSANLGEATAALDRLLKVSYQDKGLGDGEEYYYRITAYNEGDLESEFSRSVKGMTTPEVGSVVAEGDKIREIHLSWQPIDTPFIRGYYIYRSASEKEGFVRIKRLEAPSSRDRRIEYEDREGLGDLIRYYYRVSAIEEGDIETSPSAVVSAITKGKPAMPEGLKAEGGQVKKVDLSWTASTADDVEGYRIYGAREGEGELVLLKTLSGRQIYRYTDESRGYGNNLEDGTTYRYRLTTYNRVDLESEPSQAVTARTKPRPQKVSGLQGDSAKARAVPLRWSANQEKDIVQYHLYRAGESGDFSRIAKLPETAYSDRDVKDDTLYRYRVQAEDTDGLIGDFSETILLRTKARPAAPADVTGVIVLGKTVLAWKPAAEPDIDYYTVYEKKFFANDKVAAVREPKFSEAPPPKGKTKVYLITTTDRDGLESDPGPEITITGP